MNFHIERIANNTKLSVLLLCALSAVFFIGLGQVHLFDWDEINFAESAREMMASGDYLRVQINFEPFWEKPPFFFWLQVASMKLFGINEYAARFPNAVFGLIYLLTFYFIGKKHFSAKFGLIWALLFYASLLPHIYFKSGIIDPVFNYFIFMSIYFMMMVVSGDNDNRGRLAIYSGLFSGFSVITKGPVGFLLLGLTLFVYLVIKKFKPFPKIKHILAFFLGLVVIIGAWLSIEIGNNGFTILQKFIEYQAELFNADVAGHAQPFYYHFVVVFFGCFPISIIALPALFKKRWELPFNFQTWMLCLFWSVLILFSLTTTKIIHYSSMTYIPLSFIAAMVIYKSMKEEFEFKRGIRITFLIVGILLSILMIAIPVIFIFKHILYNSITDPYTLAILKTPVHWSGIEVLGGIIFFAGVIAAYIFLKKKLWNKFLITLASTLAFTLLFDQYMVVDKIERMTQGVAISFYESKQDEDCYVEMFGFKSYAQYFYSRQPFGYSKDQRDMTWLMNGPIDKPVYIVTKIDQMYLDTHPYFTYIRTEGGFKFYQRLPK